MRRHAIAAIVLAHVVVAIALTFSSIHRLHTADSIIFTLNSLYIQSPFFWQQDRVGMLVPLAVSWIRDPFVNLLANTGITIFAGLLTPIVLAATLRLGVSGAIGATLLNAIFVYTAPAVLIENQYIVCCYPLAMTLGFGGLLLLPPDAAARHYYPRVLAALLCVVLAFWVYVAVVVVLLPLAVLRSFAAEVPNESIPNRIRRTLTAKATWWGIGYCIFGLAVGFAAMVGSRSTYAVAAATPMGMLPPEAWLPTACEFFVQIAALPHAMTWLSVWAVVVAASIVARSVFGSSGRTPWGTIITLLVVGFGELVFASSREWTAMNKYHPRYLLGMLLAWQLAAVTFLIQGVRWPSRLGQVVSYFAVLLLIVAAIARYGWPSWTGTRQLIDDEMGQQTPTLLALNCDAYHANYWALWPVIYHANLVRHERGDTRLFLPLGMRAAYWRPYWEHESARHPMRVAMPPTDCEDFNYYRHWWGFAPSPSVQRQNGLEIHTLSERIDPDP